MKERQNRVRRVLTLVLALALVIPLSGPTVVMESGAVTQQEIDALKSDANQLNQQKKDIQNQLKSVRADKNDALGKKELLVSPDVFLADILSPLRTHVPLPIELAVEENLPSSLIVMDSPTI